MKIVVAVKAAAALDDEFELDDDHSVDADYLEWEVNEWDNFSLEAAVQLKEANDGEVVIVTVGDEESEEAMLECLAKGADRAVRIWDDSLEDADPLAVAKVLAAFVEKESPDLVLTGVQSSDGVSAAVGTAMAALLDMPRVAVVKSLDYSGGQATVERELEGGLIEVLRVNGPALLTIQTGINEPRYANLRAIKQARDKPLDVIEPGDLGVDESALDAAAGYKLRSLARPEQGEGAEMIEGSASDIAARIAEIVKERVA